MTRDIEKVKTTTAVKLITQVEAGPCERQLQPQAMIIDYLVNI